MKTFNEFLNESVLRHTWDTVTTDDVDKYVKANNLKLVRDKSDKDLYTAVPRSGTAKVIFRYDIDSMKLYSDYTIIQLEDGKAK